MYTPILKYVLQLFTTTKKFSDEFLIKMNHNHNISSFHTFRALSTTQVRSCASCCLVGRCTTSRTIASASISAMKAASAASCLCHSSGDMSNRRPPLRSLGSTEYFFVVDSPKLPWHTSSTPHHCPSWNPGLVSQPDVDHLVQQWAYIKNTPIQCKPYLSAKHMLYDMVHTMRPFKFKNKIKSLSTPFSIK
jgi:hypothetical protein